MLSKQKTQQSAASGAPNCSTVVRSLSRHRLFPKQNDPPLASTGSSGIHARPWRTVLRLKGFCVSGVATVKPCASTLITQAALLCFRGRPRRRNAVSEPASRQRSASGDQRPRRTFVVVVIDVSTVSLTEHTHNRKKQPFHKGVSAADSRHGLNLPPSQDREVWLVADNDATPADMI